MAFDFTSYEQLAAAMDRGTIQAALLDIAATLPSADNLDRADGGDRGGRYRDQASVLRTELVKRGAGGPPANANDIPEYLRAALSDGERHHLDGIVSGRWDQFAASDVVDHLLTIAKLRVDAERFAAAVRKPCGIPGCLGSATHADPFGGAHVCRGHREAYDADLLGREGVR